MDLLIHACCAPCSTYCVKIYTDSYRVALFWFNPNIHPYTEYKKRLDSMLSYHVAELVLKDEYLLEEFFERTAKVDNRCSACYRWRLMETAKSASENGFDAFTTTLSISPYQDHELIRREGVAAGNIHDVEFVYNDLRNGFRESRNTAREIGLYMQKYCGCIFSEAERYLKDQCPSR